MTTKDYCLLPEKPNIVFGETSKSQYNNLNLNQNQKSSDVFAVLSKSVNIKDSRTKHDSFDNSRTNEPSRNSWDKSSNNLSASLLSHIVKSEEKDEIQKPTNTNISTLSLHIAAYENAFEVVNGSVNVKLKHGLAKTWDTVQPLVTSLSSKTKNPFEFPRQQSDKETEPEIIQFKSSQKLLNPNATISRVEHSIFYNSLTEEQKQYFSTYEKEYKQMENELLQTKIQLNEEKRKNENRQMSQVSEDAEKQIPDSEEVKLEKELLSKGIDIKSKVPSGTELSNAVYYALLKLIHTKPERRQKILEFFGMENRESDSTILSLSYLRYFENEFKKSRATAIKKGKLVAFDQQIVVFPSEKLPIPTQVTPDNLESEISDRDSDMPTLEAMDTSGPLPEAPDTTKPLIKRIRLDGDTIYVPLTANFEIQTDLTMKQISKLEEIKKRFKSLQDKLRYHKNNKAELKDRNADYENLIVELENECDEFAEEVDKLQLLQDENAKLKQQIRERDEIICETNEKMANQANSNKICLKNKSGKFTVDAHACFSRLVSQGTVAQDKVAIVIRILADLFNVEVDAVPSRWTVGRDINMIHALNCQYAETVIRRCSNWSFLSDETSKFFKKLQSFVLLGKDDETNEDLALFLGGIECPTKCAADALKAYIQRLTNIARINGTSAEKLINDVFINTRNLMGDQAETQNLLYNLYIAYRNSIIEKSDYDEQTKAGLERVNIFFCLLHVLQNTSSVVFDALLEHEKLSTGNESATSGVVEWVIKELSRRTAKRTSAKYSSAADWNTFGTKKGLKYFKIDSFLGHRFIIRYVIAAEIVYNRQHLIEFLETIGGEDETLTALKDALENELVILHLHVLALLGVLILSPLWQLSESSESVLETSLYAPALINYLKNLIEEPMILFNGTSPFDAFPAAAPKHPKGKEFLSSLKQLPPPAGASEVIPIVAKPLLDYFEKQLAPFITGTYSFPDIALERQTAGAPSTNMACESSFGFLDRSFAIQPNMTTHNRSALMSAAKMKLFEKITKLPENEQKEMYEKAVKSISLSASLAKEQQQQLQRELVAKMEREEIERAKLKEKVRQKRHKAAADVGVEGCGFWQTIPEMEEAIKRVNRTKAIQFIKANIRYRKLIWSPNFEPKHLLQFSHQKHAFNFEELQSNLKAVIYADSADPTNYHSDSEDGEE